MYHGIGTTLLLCRRQRALTDSTDPTLKFILASERLTLLVRVFPPLWVLVIIFFFAVSTGRRLLFCLWTVMGAKDQRSNVLQRFLLT